MDDDNDGGVYATYDYGFPPATGASVYPPDSLIPALPALPTLPAFSLPTSTSLYIPISSQTPYERAQAEHAQAFATYQARYSQPSTSTSTSTFSDNAFASTSTDLSALGGANAASRAVSSRAVVYGAHSFTQAARSWNPPADEHGNGWTGARKSSMLATGEKGVPGAGGELGQIEERRRLLREEAERAVNEAKEVRFLRLVALSCGCARTDDLDDTQTRSIPSLLKAHTLASRSQLTIPPPLLDPSLPLHGIELTMQQLGKFCETKGYNRPHQLQMATHAFVDKWLRTSPRSHL